MRLRGWRSGAKPLLFSRWFCVEPPRFGPLTPCQEWGACGLWPQPPGPMRADCSQHTPAVLDTQAVNIHAARVAQLRNFRNSDSATVPLGTNTYPNRRFPSIPAADRAPTSPVPGLLSNSPCPTPAPPAAGQAQNPLCSRVSAGSVQGCAPAPEAGTQDRRSPLTVQTVAGSAIVR